MDRPTREGRPLLHHNLLTGNRALRASGPGGHQIPFQSPPRLGVKMSPWHCVGSSLGWPLPRQSQTHRSWEASHQLMAAQGSVAGGIARPFTSWGAVSPGAAPERWGLGGPRVALQSAAAAQHTMNN